MQRTAVCAALLMLSGCDDVRNAFDASEIEQQLREDPGRPGKVGSLVGVSVYQRAARTAGEIDSAPQPDCSLTVGPGQEWRATIEIERVRLNEVVASWNERRTLARTATGAELTSTASYETMIDQQGSRTRAWRRIGADAWVSFEGAEGPLWYHRDADEGEAQRQLDSSIGTFQALLDAVDGWKRSGDGTYVPGDERLRCVRADEGLAFVDRFVVRATLREAALRATPQRRNYEATWDLEDGTRLRVRYEDEVTAFAAGIAAPPPERIVPIERDRSLARARKLADDLAEAGLVTLPAKAEEGDTVD